MTTSLRTHFLTFARYHVWATRRLLNDHVAALPEADYRRDCGLFLKSIHGTLNHLLVGEHLLWFSRFAQGVSPGGVALDAEAETDRAALSERLIASAHAWGPFIEALPEDRFASAFSYTSSKGVPVTAPYAATLAHVFNHATHHRGQITAALTMLGHPCPELDLIYMLQAERERQQ